MVHLHTDNKNVASPQNAEFIGILFGVECIARSLAYSWELTCTALL